MTKKITNYEIVQLLNNLKMFENKKLPQKISYAIMKNVIVITKEYEIYIKQLENIISNANKEGQLELDEHGQILETANGIPKVKKEFIETFNKDIEELLNFKVDVDYHFISEDTFNYDEGVRYDVLTPMEVFTLRSCLCENYD